MSKSLWEFRDKRTWLIFYIPTADLGKKGEAQVKPGYLKKSFSTEMFLETDRWKWSLESVLMALKVIAHRKIWLYYSALINSLATICQIFRACSISFLAQNKLRFIQHLSGPANTFLSLNDFRCKYEIDPRPLSFYGLISAVESLRNDFNFQDLQNSNHES